MMIKTLAAGALLLLLQGWVEGAKDAREFHTLVFGDAAVAADADSCHSLKSKDQCVAGHCSWCECAAVPSSCYTDDEAAQLPAAVFNCVKEMDWAVKQVCVWRAVLCRSITLGLMRSLLFVAPHRVCGHEGAVWSMEEGAQQGLRLAL